MAVSDFEGPDGHLLCDVRRPAMRVSHSVVEGSVYNSTYVW